MGNVTTEAWVIYAAPEGSTSRQPAELKREEFSFSDINEHEVLAEPIYGCWEGNMTHALERRPIDVCRYRGEEKVVIGNAGVVRILKTGSNVSNLKTGDLCIVFCNGIWDEHGFPERILGYDAPHTIGVLAKRMKLHEKQLIKVPEGSPYSLQQWAAFSLRYVTAWANWQRAYGCWKTLGAQDSVSTPKVWGWGGGVSLAELALARRFGCEAALISSIDERLCLIKRMDLTPIDRRQFPNLHLDEAKYNSEPAYRKTYQEAEETFLKIVEERTDQKGVSIFVDFIGAPVFRATLKALSRQGVITTAGWKQGMITSTLRAVECMKWHVHVHTHYARYKQGVEAVNFAEANGWLPPVNGEAFEWEDIPLLAEDYRNGRLATYFPIFRVNAP
jgi:NADPH:quinone reductase-like Zn-dependent oxidoreductase